MTEKHRNDGRFRGGAAVALAAILGACGGGGGGSSSGGEELGGLALPAGVEVVLPRGSSSPGSSAATASFDPDAEYFTTPIVRTVYDTSLDAPAELRDVLYALAQVGSDSIQDGEPYLAQLERATRRGMDPGAAAASAGRSYARATSLRQLATVRSRRQGGNAQIVEMWLSSEFEGIPYTLRARAAITRSVSATRPLGEFTLNYAGLDGSGLDNPLFFGTVEATQVGSSAELVLYHDVGDLFAVPDPGDRFERVQGHVRIGEDGRLGEAKLLARERSDSGTGDTGIQAEQFLLGYNNNFLVRAHNGDTAVVRSRESVREIVWKYGLFHASGPRAGQAVQPDEGFGFRSASGELGYVGPRGVWIAVDPVPLDGEEVQREEFGQLGEAEVFTLVTAPGRLVRHTRQDIPLIDVVGLPFEWARYDEGTDTTTVKRVTYEAGQWTADAIFDFGEQDWEPIDPPDVLNTVALGHLDLWSYTLGGRVTWLHGDASVLTYEREVVDGDDAAFGGGMLLELFAVEGGLRSGVTAGEAEVGDVFFDAPASPATAHRFEFHADDLTLYWDDGGTLREVGLANGEVPTVGPNRWGMNSGPLVTSVAGMTSSSDLFGEPEFYSYETGANPWNAFVGLRDVGGDMVTADAPIRFEYHHVASADRNGGSQFDGVTFVLEYSGDGRLTGLPQAPVDRDQDGLPDRYEPRVNLEDGLLVGPTGTEYVLRALELEEVPRVGSGLVPSLSVASDLPFTDGSEYTAPAIGGAPTVTDPPRVVNGRVLEADEPPVRP